MVMPSGTIHAVFTPHDSMVIGGHCLFPEALVAAMRNAWHFHSNPGLTNVPFSHSLVRDLFTNLIKVTPSIPVIQRLKYRLVRNRRGG